MGEPYRALVIGCGRIGSRNDEMGAAITASHAGAYAKEARTRLVGLCDTDPARVGAAAHFWNVPGYRVMELALSELQPELVSICTPDETHAEVLDRVLEADSVRAVLAEKPIALNDADAVRISRKAAAKKVALAVNYSRRFHPAFRRAQSAVRAGRIGAVRSLLGYYSRGIKHNGTHWIDLARWFVSDVRAVRADAGVVEWPHDPTPDVRMTFACGAIGFLKGVDQRAYALFEMDVLGDEGRLRIFQGPRFIWSRRVPDTRNPEFYYLQEETAQTVPPESPILEAVANLCDCVEGISEPLCGADDAICALAVATACERSLSTGAEEQVA